MLTTKNLLDPRHTPGPWEVAKEYSVHGFYIDAPAAKDAEPGLRLATVELRDWWPEYPRYADLATKTRHPKAGQVPDYAEGRANAALFAEAPELAKAVREYLTHWEELAADTLEPMRVVCCARSVLSAAQPLYDLLAKVYGVRKEVAHV